MMALMWRTIRRSLLVLGLLLILGGVLSLTGTRRGRAGPWYVEVRPWSFIVQYVARNPSSRPASSREIDLAAITAHLESGNGVAVSVYGYWLWLGGICVVPAVVHRLTRRAERPRGFPIDSAPS